MSRKKSKKRRCPHLNMLYGVWKSIWQLSIVRVVFRERFSIMRVGMAEKGFRGNSAFFEGLLEGRAQRRINHPHPSLPPRGGGIKGEGAFSYKCKNDPAVLPGIKSQSAERLFQCGGGDHATNGLQAKQRTK